MQDINNLLINRPCPWQRTNADARLHSLIHYDPNASMHEHRDWPDDAIVAHNSPRNTSKHAHTVMMRVVEEIGMPGVVGGCDAEVVSDCACGDIGCWTASYKHFEPV